jgi:hypothetical protein
MSVVAFNSFFPNVRVAPGHGRLELQDGHGSQVG